MKSKYLLRSIAISTLAVLFSCFESSAQKFGVGISPEITTRNLVKTDFVPGIEQFIEESNSLNEPIVGFTVQAFFVKPFARKMFFETGLSLSQDGYNSFARDFTYESLILSGLVNSEDPVYETTQEIEIQNRFLSIGIPLRLAYLSAGDKWRFTWSFGVTPEYVLESASTRIFRFESGAEESFDTDFDSTPADFNLTAALSAGVEWAIDRQSALRVEPVIRYGVFPTFDEAAYEVNLFSYGLSLKYFFKLDLLY